MNSRNNFKLAFNHWAFKDIGSDSSQIAYFTVTFRWDCVCRCLCNFYIWPTLESRQGPTRKCYGTKILRFVMGLCFWWPHRCAILLLLFWVLVAQLCSLIHCTHFYKLDVKFQWELSNKSQCDRRRFRSSDAHPNVTLSQLEGGVLLIKLPKPKPVSHF